MTASRRRLARSALHLANRAGAAVDALAAGSGPQHGAVTPLFVVGLPRSGTTLAYELMVQGFEFAFFTPLSYYTYGMPNLTTRLTRHFTRHPRARYESSYGHIAGRFSPAENSVFWSRWFPEHPVLGHHLPAGALSTRSIQDANRSVASISVISGRQFVFKNVYFTLALRALLETFPRARALVVSRDLHAVAASIYTRRRALQGERSWWSLRPPFSAEIADRALIEQVAFQCVRASQLLERELTLVDRQRVQVVDYARLCDAPADFLAAMGQWLDGTARPRKSLQVPERFEVRPSVGFGDEDTRRFDDAASMLVADRDAYLARVDEAAGMLLHPVPGGRP